MYSRRELYAAGEPFGDSCTRIEAGRIIYGGGGSRSSSAQTTTNQDNRVAVQDGIGMANSSGNVITVTDGGIVARALDSVDLQNAIGADGFSRLLDAAESLFNRGEAMIGQTQQFAAEAYSRAIQDQRGTIDNRTIIVIAGVAAAALILTKGRK